MKKIVPIALMLTVATTAGAGAANLQGAVIKVESSLTSQAQYEYMQQICEKFDFSLCGRPQNCPVVKPETTPDTTPDTTLDTTPDTIPDTTPEEKPETDTDASIGNFASEVVRLVNVERAKNGLSALSVSTGVQQAAQVRAAEQVKSFSHTRPNGTSCFTALTEAGVSYRGAGENIAYGQQTPAAVMNSWMNSSGHRANILNANFTTIGVGYTVINGTPYWAQMFTY